MFLGLAPRVQRATSKLRHTLPAPGTKGILAAAHDQGVWETLCDLLERQDVSNNLTL